MEDITLTGVPIIVIIVYIALLIYKGVVNEKENLIKIIPIIAFVLGVALGITGFYLASDIILADNILQAILIGGCSGLAATGTHQIVKIFTKAGGIETEISEISDKSKNTDENQQNDLKTDDK